jgi:Cytochrome c7 and related cytochrome c
MRRLPKFIAVIIVAILAAGFFLLRAMGGPQAPRQPVEFDHWQHVSKKDGPELDCSFCHAHADKSPYATIPDIDTCMICHSSEKTESPEVQKLAAFGERGEQPPWARVYWFYADANVFFTHKPHLRAELDCSACHGEVSSAHRLRREVNQSMGWCIDCHRARQASVDCYACHR